MSTLSEQTFERISAQLKRYGIESPELLAELSDHYAHEMEERMAGGMSEEAAFNLFKVQNSWLKLRKLQYKHWEQGVQSMQQAIKGQLYQLFLGPLGLVCYPVIIALWWLFGHDLGAVKSLIATIHFALAAFMLSIPLTIVFRKLHKQQYYAYLFQVSLFGAYMLIYIPVMFGRFFEIVANSHQGLTWRLAFTAFYTLALMITYITVKLYAIAKGRSVKA